MYRELPGESRELLWKSRESINLGYPSLVGISPHHRRPIGQIVIQQDPWSHNPWFGRNWEPRKVHRVVHRYVPLWYVLCRRTMIAPSVQWNSKIFINRSISSRSSSIKWSNSCSGRTSNRKSSYSLRSITASRKCRELPSILLCSPGGA